MKKVEFKEDVDPRDIFRFTALCRILFIAVLEYCREHKLKLVITSLISDRRNVKSISTTHETGRAFDIRIRDFEGDQAADMVAFFNHSYKNIAAISKTDNKPRCAILKKDHIHFQVRRS